MIPSVEVYVAQEGTDVLAGVAHFMLRRGFVSTTFGYDAAYLAHPQAYAIDPHMPLSSAVHHVEGLPGAFRDSAPDRWGRNLIAKRIRLESLKEGQGPKGLDDVTIF